MWVDSQRKIIFSVERKELKTDTIMMTPKKYAKGLMEAIKEVVNDFVEEYEGVDMEEDGDACVALAETIEEAIQSYMEEN